MTEDWFYFKTSQKLICLSIVISGLLGWLIFGGAGCVYSILCTLGIELIWWASNN